MELGTPLYDLHQHPNVYEPSEDTFLMLDALEQELPWLLERRPLLVAEIGSGSGVNVTALIKALNSSSSKSLAIGFASDVNVTACSATRLTARLNHIPNAVQCCNMDLLGMFRDGMFDVILFNPPYVPTLEEEMDGYSIERAWAGGLNGRRIIDRFCTDVLPHALSVNGVCYLLVLKDNNVDDLLESLRRVSFVGETIKERKILGEHLYVLKIRRQCAS